MPREEWELLQYHMHSPQMSKPGHRVSPALEWDDEAGFHTDLPNGWVQYVGRAIRHWPEDVAVVNLVWGYSGHDGNYSIFVEALRRDESWVATYHWEGPYSSFYFTDDEGNWADRDEDWQPLGKDEMLAIVGKLPAYEMRPDDLRGLGFMFNRGGPPERTFPVDNYVGEEGKPF